MYLFELQNVLVQISKCRRVEFRSSALSVITPNYVSHHRLTHLFLFNVLNTECFE